MRLRGAAFRDFKRVNELFEEYKFKFEPKHLTSLVVVEDDNKTVVAVGSLQTMLEAAFVVDQRLSRKNRVAILEMLLEQSKIEAINSGYDNFHAFGTNESIIKILKRKFEFKKTEAIEVLIKWVNNG